MFRRASFAVATREPPESRRAHPHGHSQGGNDAIEIARRLRSATVKSGALVSWRSGLARKSSIEGNGGDPAMLPSAERQESRERAPVERDFEKLRRRRLAAVAFQLRALLLAHTRTQNSRPGRRLALEAICLHLEALTFGDIPGNRLLMNMPPGFIKSPLVNVFRPCWAEVHATFPHALHLVFLFGRDHYPRQQQDGSADHEASLHATVR
jgi:hypothetical protein